MFLADPSPASSSESTSSSSLTAPSSAGDRFATRLRSVEWVDGFCSRARESEITMWIRMRANHQDETHNPAHPALDPTNIANGLHLLASSSSSSCSAAPDPLAGSPTLPSISSLVKNPVKNATQPSSSE